MHRVSRQRHNLRQWVRGWPQPRRDGGPAARTLLQQSKQLRAGQPDTTLVDEYLRAATTGQGPPR